MRFGGRHVNVCHINKGAVTPMTTASSAVPDPFAPPLSRREWKRLRRLHRADRPRFWSWSSDHPLGGWRLPAMILGFIAWWPIGLALLGYFLWRPAMSCRNAAWMTPWKEKVRDHVASFAGTGNLAFDEYRAATLARLEEERRQLDIRQAEFATFVQQLRRAKDQEEFERFMQSRSDTA